MPRKKTSLAEFRSARFNPIHEDEARALAIIKRYEEQGVSFKELVVTAVNALDGNQELYASPNRQYTYLANKTDEIYELLSKLVTKAVGTVVKDHDIDDSDYEEDESSGVSPFAQRFAKSFVQRQKQGNVDDDQ